MYEAGDCREFPRWTGTFSLAHHLVLFLKLDVESNLRKSVPAIYTCVFERGGVSHSSFPGLAPQMGRLLAAPSCLALHVHFRLKQFMKKTEGHLQRPSNEKGGTEGEG